MVKPARLFLVSPMKMAIELKEVNTQQGQNGPKVRKCSINDVQLTRLNLIVIKMSFGMNKAKKSNENKRIL